MTTSASSVALAIAFLLPATTAAAQREGYSYLSYVGPEVALVSTAEDDSSARPNTPILAGDRISTGSTSRAEAILADGNILRIDVQTDLRFDRLARTYEAEDDRNSLFVDRGAISLEHRWSTSRDQSTRIDTSDVTVLFPAKGLLRVETGRRGTEIYVVSGQAEVYARSGRATLRAGQYAFATGDAALEVDWLDEPRDRFTRFVGERRHLVGEGSGSQHGSADYAYDYAAAGFEEHGSWILVNGSHVWRPSVAADWRPYVEGYWRWSPAGLTWVSYEPWGWLPYHYGSWCWDVAVGWYWSPGATYSPAWVYWSYTPSWVGWCPIGFYGGYYGGYYGGGYGGGYTEPYARSHRKGSGAEGGTLAYPHLRGRVDVTRIDPRGWSYASVGRLGTRFDSRRDVLGHDRVGFRAGERGVVATSPLRIERGNAGSVTTAVQDAVRRVPLALGAETRGGGPLDDITPVLRRDGALGTAAREGLRRSFVTPGKDLGYRPTVPGQVAAPRREPVAGATAGAPSRGGDRGPGSGSTTPRGAEGAAPGRGAGSAPRDAWRDGGVGAEAPLTGGFGRDRGLKSDDGWRSPGGEDRSGTTPPRTFDGPSRRIVPVTDSPEAPQRTERRESAPEPGPRRSTAEPSSRRETPAQAEPGTVPSGRRPSTDLKGDEGWRGSDAAPRSSDAPRSAPAPRSEAPSRSDRASPPLPPQRGSALGPRPAPSETPPGPAPRRPPARSEPPSRSDSAPPPSRSYEAPRSAPAPPSYSSPPPASRSNDAPPRSDSPRG